MPIVRLCPECNAEIILEDVLDAELIECPDCGFDLEVAVFNPKDPEEVEVIRKRVLEQGTIEGSNKTYDVSNIDFSQSPALIPGPQTQEDHGE